MRKAWLMEEQTVAIICEAERDVIACHTAAYVALSRYGPFDCNSASRRLRLA
jgi:hypothetical protein